MPEISNKLKKYYKHKLQIPLKQIQSEIEIQVVNAIKSGIKSKHITISDAAQNKFKKALYKMMVEIFNVGLKQTRSKLQKLKRKHKQIKEFDNIPAVFKTAMQESYNQRAKVYENWFWTEAQNISKERFKNTVTKAQNIIQEGIKKGLTPDESRELLLTKFSEYTDSQIERVMITEHDRAMNLSTIAGCGDDDSVVGYRYAVNFTGCEECLEHEKETSGNNWIPKDEITEYCPWHPNCHCSVEPVFKFEIEDK
jgi:hypothetical protein